MWAARQGQAGSGLGCATVISLRGTRTATRAGLASSWGVALLPAAQAAGGSCWRSAGGGWAGRLRLDLGLE